MSLERRKRGLRASAKRGKLDRDLLIVDADSAFRRRCHHHPHRRKQQTPFPGPFPSVKLTCSPPFLEDARAATRAAGRAVLFDRVEGGESRKEEEEEATRGQLASKKRGESSAFLFLLGLSRSLSFSPAASRVEPARPRTAGRATEKAMVGKEM